MPKLPDRFALGAPPLRVPGGGIHSLGSADTGARHVSKGISDLMTGLTAGFEENRKKRDDYEVNKLLIEHSKEQQRQLEESHRSMPAGGEGFSEGWNQNYETGARGVFSRGRERGLGPDALAKLDLGLLRAHEASFTRAHAYEQEERRRFNKENTEHDLTGYAREAAANPDRLPFFRDQGLLGIDTSSLDARDKYAMRRWYLRHLEDQVLTALANGILSTEDANRARQRLYGDLAPGPPERRDRSGSDFGPVAPPPSGQPVAPPAGRQPLQEERAVGAPEAPPLTITPIEGQTPRGARAREGRIEGIVLHHTSGTTLDSALSQNQLAATGYNYYIDRDGSVRVLAPDGQRMNHIMPPGHANRIPGAWSNLSSDNTIGISVVARGDADMTDKQRTTLRALTGQLAAQYRIDPKNIVGHGDLQHTRERSEGSLAREFREGRIALAPAGDRPGAPRVAQASGSQVGPGYVQRSPGTLPTDRPAGAGGPAGAFATPGDQAEYARQMAGEQAMWPRGMVAPGNVDSVIRNPDRTTSAVPSYSVPATINGEQRQVLIPAFAPDGRSLTQRQATEQFQATNRYLGIFDTDENARAFASAEAQNTQLPGPMRVGGRLWADALERAENEGTYARRGGIFQTVSPAKIAATRRAIDARERALIAPLEQEMTRWETIARDGKLPPEANVAQVLERVEAIDDPLLTQHFRSVVDLAAFTRQFRTLPPSQMDRLIDLEERRQLVEGASDVADKRLKHMVALRNAARTAISTDQNGWANTVGVVPSGRFDGSLTSFADDGVMREHLAQSRAAALWLSEQGTPRQPQFFSPEQKQTAQGILRQGGRPMLDMVASMVRHWGDDAPRALAEFAKDDPELAYIGGMYLDAKRLNGVGMQAVMDAAHGVALRRDENVKKAMTRDLPTEAELRDAVGGVLGNTFQLSRPTRDAAIATANLIYLARQKDISAFDPTLWRQALKEALGEHTVGNTTYGGIYHQRRGLFGGGAGNPIQVPANIRQDGGALVLRDALRIEDLIDPFGEGPRTRNGNIVSMDVIRRSTLVSAGSGRYWLAQGDPSGSQPQWVLNSDGKPYVLDLNALEPVLRQRRPEEYSDYTEPQMRLTNRQQRLVEALTPRDQRRAGEPDVTRTLPGARALSPGMLYEFRRQFVRDNPDPNRRRAIEGDRERYGQELQRFIERTPGLRDSSPERLPD